MPRGERVSPVRKDQICFVLVIVMLGCGMVGQAVAGSSGNGRLVDDEAAEESASSGSETAAEEHDEDDSTTWAHRDWRFFVAPYGWLAGVKGTIVTNGEETHIDVPFKELASRARGGFQLYFEARRNKFFLAFDGTWATLGETIEGRFFDTDIEIKQRLYDIRVGYEVYNRTIGPPPADPEVNWRRRIITDFYIGGRYYRTAPEVKIGPPGDQVTVLSTADSYVDPFIGLRFGYDFSYRWGIGFRGDIGGFGIGDAAEFSWQAQLGLGYKLSQKISLIAGYRWLAFDTVTGEGEDRNGEDLTQQGPTIGAGFKF